MIDISEELQGERKGFRYLETKSCDLHPKYRGIRQPRSGCQICWNVLANNKQRDISDMATLQEKAMIVTLRTGGWSGRHIDRNVTKDVETRYSAGTNAGRYLKFIVDPSALEPVERVIAKAKVWIYNNTFPWSNNGDAVLPVAKHLECVTKMNEFKQMLEDEVDKLEAGLPALKKEAKNRLGKMFVESEFPTTLKNEFRLEVSFSPIPSEGDWRVNLSEEEVKKLSKEIENRNSKFLEESTKEMYNRLYDVVKKLTDRINAKQSNKSSKLHGASLVNSIISVIDSMETMNIADDKGLRELANDLKNLGDIDPELLKKDELYREVAKTEAEKGLSKIEQKMGGAYAVAKE